MFRQRSIQNLVRTTGVGVHSGRRVELTLRPAQPNTGIVFHRVDLPEVVDLPAQAAGVGDTRMASVLQQGNVRVSTVEHLMSALAGLGIDNLHVDLTAEEVPIMDGSAATFVYLLRSAGIVEQNAPKQFIRVLKPVEVREGEGRNEKWARLEPHDGFALAFSIDFRHPAIDSTANFAEIDFATHSYVRGSLAHAPSASSTKSRRCARWAWPAAAAWTMPSLWTSTACSTATGCVTTTNS